MNIFYVSVYVFQVARRLLYLGQPNITIGGYSGTAYLTGFRVTAAN